MQVQLTCRMMIALLGLLLTFSGLTAIHAPAFAQSDTTTSSQTFGNVRVVTTVNNTTGAVTVEVFGPGTNTKTTMQQDGRAANQTKSTKSGDSATTTVDGNGTVETTPK
jgi:hypothetical protein